MGEGEAGGGDPVPRGLERLHEELLPSRARVDNLFTTAGQRDQENLATFHLDAGRRAFEREADREAIQELRRALYLSPYLAEAHLLLGPPVSARRPPGGGGRGAEDRALERGDRGGARQSSPRRSCRCRTRPRPALEIDRALALDPKSAEALALKAKLGGAW